MAGAAQDVYARTDPNASEKLTEAESDAMISKAQANFTVALAKADGPHNIAIEKCGAFKDVDKKACLRSTADATFAANQATGTPIAMRPWCEQNITTSRNTGH